MSSRKLNQKLIADAEKRIAKNPLASEIVKAKDKSKARILLVELAKMYIGTREEGGNNKGAVVNLFQDTVGAPMAQAWCMNFVQSMIALVEHFLGVKSSLIASEGCAQVWAAASTAQKVKKIPAAGAVIIWGKYSAKGKYLGGHTGLVDFCDGEYFYGVEGNTESGIAKNAQVVRDGGGVYHTKRSMKGQGSMKLRGFLKPF